MKKLASAILVAALPVSLAAQARAIHLVEGSRGDSSWKVPAQFTPVANSTVRGKGSARFPSFGLSRYMTLTAFRASEVDGL